MLNAYFLVGMQTSQSRVWLPALRRLNFSGAIEQFGGIIQWFKTASTSMGRPKHMAQPLAGEVAASPTK